MRSCLTISSVCGTPSMTTRTSSRARPLWGGLATLGVVSTVALGLRGRPLRNGNIYRNLYSSPGIALGWGRKGAEGERASRAELRADFLDGINEASSASRRAVRRFQA